MKQKVLKRCLAFLLALCAVVPCSSAFASGNGEMMDMIVSLGKVRNADPAVFNAPVRTDRGVVLTFRGFVESQGKKKIKGLEQFCVPAPRGKVYLYLLLDVENNGSEDFTLNFLFGSVMATVDGADMDYDLQAGITGAIEGIDAYESVITVEPGQKTTRYVPFCAPKNWKQIRILVGENESVVQGSYLFYLNRRDV